MADGIDLPVLIDLARAGGGIAVFGWLVLMLLRRGDSLQRENIDELRRQRDDWRRRAEHAEAALNARTDP